MVRLKADVPISECPESLFQFHYGSVKSLEQANGAQENHYFNSTMVRLKVF